MLKNKTCSIEMQLFVFVSCFRTLYLFKNTQYNASLLPIQILGVFSYVLALITQTWSFSKLMCNSSTFFSHPIAAVVYTSKQNIPQVPVCFNEKKMEQNTAAVTSTQSQPTEGNTLNDDVSHNQHVVGNENNEDEPEVVLIIVALPCIVLSYLVLIVFLWLYLGYLKR